MRVKIHGYFDAISNLYHIIQDIVDNLVALFILDATQHFVQFVLSMESKSDKK